VAKWGTAFRRDIVSVLVILGLVGAVYLLPPDTSLAQLRENGVLRVCIPPSYPPLVQNDSAAPGYDVELVTEIARRLDLRVSFTANAAIIRDFNPRSWGITRAQCQMLAGGVVVSPTTLSFLDATPSSLETGWAIIASTPLQTLSGQTVGVYSGISGLDRLGLSAYLRNAGATASIVTSTAALVSGIAEGRFTVGIAEALTAQSIARGQGWTVAWVPAGPRRFPLALGFWKGDLTIKRAVTRVLDELRAEGFLDALAAKYGIGTIPDLQLAGGA
jgi:polar amino acid transport system substrate-binding protein/cystine transport system substrate-binding protein/membrane-bound lytic murein transglycosylase F